MLPVEASAGVCDRFQAQAGDFVDLGEGGLELRLGAVFQTGLEGR
jgi:hypothetical protein